MKLELNEAQLTTVMQALAAQPFQAVAQLIGEIQKQAQANQTQTQTDEEPEDG